VSLPADPIWDVLEEQGRSLVWLAKWTGFSEAYVRDIRARRFPTTATFRAACSRALQIHERHLFATVAAQPEEVAANG